MEYFDYLAGFGAAMLASLIGSFSGGGSSLVMMPLLIMFIPQSYIFLLSVNKVRGLVMNSVSSAIHLKKNKLNKKLLVFILIFGLIGTAVGTYFLQITNKEILSKFLGVLLFITALYLIKHSKLGNHKNEIEKKLKKSDWIVIAIFSLLLNIISGLFGGTGIFMTAFLVIFIKMSFIRAAAHTMVIYMILNFTQIMYLLSIEKTDILLIILAIVGAYIGSLIGTKLQYVKGNLWVKMAAILMMLIISIKLFFV